MTAVAATVSNLTCDHCAGPIRLFGIEPHPRFPDAELHSYVCERCDRIETMLVPSATGRGVSPSRK